MQSHLKLVLDNLWMKNVIVNRSGIKYLVVCFASKEDSSEDDVLDVVNHKINHITRHLNESDHKLDSLAKAFQNIRTKIDNIANHLY